MRTGNREGIVTPHPTRVSMAHTPIFNYQHIPLLGTVDVLVIGGGSAGCLAALAASHASPYTVALVERYGFLGGTSTQMLDTFYGFFTPSEAPKKIVAGLPDQVVHALDVTGDIFLRPNTYGAGTGVTYNPERLKYVWDQALQHAGIQVYLHTTLVDIEYMNEETSCVVWHKSGFFRIRAKRVVDASGDADFCALADLPFERAGEHEPAQSLTTTFRMSNVDLERYEAAGGKKMLMAKMSEAVDTGTHPLPRKKGSVHEMVQRTCIATVAVKVGGLSALDMDELTQAEQEGRNQAFIYEDFLRAEVPGYEDANIIALSHQIGVRETRRVYGLHRLTKADCMNAAMPEDRVFLCGAPIEDHRVGAGGAPETYWEYIPKGGVYGIPYGTLVPQNSMIAWVAGRCFSATHDAHASCRSMAQTMSMGQATGTAALLSLASDTSAAAVSITDLQDHLRQLGALLETPTAVADVSRDGWENN